MSSNDNIIKLQKALKIYQEKDADKPKLHETMIRILLDSIPDKEVVREYKRIRKEIGSGYYS